jgi:hypothetical protein
MKKQQKTLANIVIITQKLIVIILNIYSQKNKIEQKYIDEK